MTTSHTPGPWSAIRFGSDWRAPCREDSQTSSARMIADENGQAVAMAVVSYEEWGNPQRDLEMKANARLISAAPELLEAARAALWEMSNTNAPRNSFTDATDKLDAAISKATGEAQ